MKPTLLCYNLAGERARKIELCAMRFQIRIRRVQPAEYAQTLAALSGLEEARADAAPAESFEEEMLVLANFPDALINQFLQALRRAKVAPVALKAVLTPTNRAWDSLALHKELSKERAALRSGGASAHPPQP